MTFSVRKLIDIELKYALSKNIFLVELHTPESSPPITPAKQIAFSESDITKSLEFKIIKLENIHVSIESSLYLANLLLKYLKSEISYINKINKQIRKFVFINYTT